LYLQQRINKSKSSVKTRINYAFLRAQKKGKLLTSHRSTIYPCYVPILGDLKGAGRVRLTRRKTIKIISKTNAISKNFS
jgi:hypothetical protein